MAVLEYLNENNEWKKVNAYGVSSVNGQQGDVKITPESIGAPTRDRAEKLNRELQERLEEVEQKDVTEDYENSDFYDSSKAIQFLLTFSKPGKYCLHDGTMRIYQCEIIEIGGALYHNIKEYTDDLGVTIYYYRDSDRMGWMEFTPGYGSISQMNIGTPTNKLEIANKSYVDTEILKLPKVYIGSGEMPEDCDIQFDFDEEPPIEVLTPINLSNYTYTKEQIDTMFGEYVTDIDILIGGGAE